MPQRQPLIRVVDEVSHAMDAAEPGFTEMLRRLEQMARSQGTNTARLSSHSELFERAATRLQAGDPILLLILRQEDAALLRQLAQALIR